MTDALITPFDFIEEPQSYEGFRGHRGRDTEGNCHLRGEIPSPRKGSNM